MSFSRKLSSLGAVAGRVALAAVFVSSGRELITSPGARRVGLVRQAGLPQPDALVRLAGGIMAAAGITTALDRRARWAPAVLAGTLAIITPVGHPVWREDGDEERRQHRIHILKNIGLFGALIALATAETTARGDSTCRDAEFIMKQRRRRP